MKTGYRSYLRRQRFDPLYSSIKHNLLSAGELTGPNPLEDMDQEFLLYSMELETRSLEEVKDRVIERTDMALASIYRWSKSVRLPPKDK